MTLAVAAWWISALTGAAALFACLGAADRRVAKAAWMNMFTTTSHERHILLSPSSRPFLARLGRTKASRHLGSPELASRRLALAGHPFDLEVLRGMQLATALGCSLFGVVLGFLWPFAFLLLPVAAIAGSRVPEMSLARRAARRQEQVAARVPDLVELLLATTEAGLGPAVALGRTADVLKGPLGEEIRATVREVEVGMPWQVALDHLVDRTDVPSLRGLVVALGRSQRLGSSVGVTLRRVVDDLRRERRAHAEEMARKAPIKMLFPLVFLILPSFILLTVGPVVLATIRSFR